MAKSIILFFIGALLFNYGDGKGGVVGLLIQPTGLVLILWSGWRIFKALTSKSPTVPNGVAPSVESLKYKHFYAKTGIAIDTEKREIHLKDRSTYKVYRFDQIRTWESNVQTGGGVYGGGMNGVMANLANANANNARTGLFIKVKDVDFPEWKIEFPLGSAKKELARWMEILQQTLNESTV